MCSVSSKSKLLSTPTSVKSFSSATSAATAAVWYQSLAGLSGGIVATLALHPLDLLKTRQAVMGNRDSKYSKVRTAFKTILKHEGGWKGLYSGVGANMMLSGSSWGIYFLSYGAIKSAMNIDGSSSNQMPMGIQAIAATGAGTITTIISNPMSVIRTRMVVASKSASEQRYASVWSTVRHVAKTEGFGSFYKGLGPSVVNVSHGAIQILAYEKIKKAIQSGNAPTTTETLSACVASKLIAALATYPCQNLRARQQAEESAKVKVTLRSIIKTEGARSLYRGLLPYLMHVVPNVCTVFLVYEAVAGSIG